MYGIIIVHLSLLLFLVLLPESTYLCTVERQTGLYSQFQQFKTVIDL